MVATSFVSMLATQSFDRVEYNAGKRKARKLMARAPVYLFYVRTDVRALRASIPITAPPRTLAEYQSFIMRCFSALRGRFSVILDVGGDLSDVLVLWKHCVAEMKSRKHILHMVPKACTSDDIFHPVAIELPRNPHLGAIADDLMKSEDNPDYVGANHF